MKQHIVPLIRTQKQKQLITTQTLMVYLNRSKVRLLQNYGNISQKAQTERLVSDKTQLRDKTKH